MPAKLLSLFFSGFMSATLLPVPVVSEVTLLYFVQNNKHWIAAFLLVVTLGNVLGALANYLVARFTLGRPCFFRRLEIFFKRLRSSQSVAEEAVNSESCIPKNNDRAHRLLKKFGGPVLFFSFLPFIGDPLTFAAGVVRFSFIHFLFWVTLGKFLRYAAIVAAGRVLL